MNTQDKFREDVPLYVVGALTATEMAALELHLSGCVECRSEFKSLVEASAQIGLALGVMEPPPRLREKLLRATMPSDLKSQRESKWSFWTWVPALAVVLFAVIGLLAWQRAERLQTQNRQLSAQLADSTEIMARNRSLLETLTSADALHVTLSAAGKPTVPQAKAIYSSQNATIVLTASNLSPLPEDKVYQLWLLPKSGGVPIPAGTFKAQANGSGILVLSHAPVATPKAFAVTIEPAGGSATPTMPIILVGSV